MVMQTYYENNSMGSLAAKTCWRVDLHDGSPRNTWTDDIFSFNDPEVEKLLVVVTVFDPAVILHSVTLDAGVEIPRG